MSGLKLTLTNAAMVAGTLVSFALVATACDKSDPSGLVGKPAPDFAVSPLRPAGDVKLSSLHGKVVLLDFWATWCGPCRMLMPHLEALHEKYGKEGLVVMGISNEARSTVADFKDRNSPLQYSLFLDPKVDAASKYQAQNLPTTVLIGRDGKVESRDVGFTPDSLKDLDELVARLVKG